MPTPEQEREYIAQLEKFSDAQIRSDIEHGRIPPAFVHAVTVWLSGRERASSSEQMEIARRASDAAERAAAEAARASTAADRAASATERQATAAEQQAVEARRANTRATIALVIAIISMIVSAIGIWVTHWDSTWTKNPSQSPTIRNNTNAS